MSEEIMNVTSNEMAIADDVYTPVEGYINTFDLTTNEGKMKTIKYTTGSEPLSQHVGEVLNICDAFTMPGVRKSRIPGVDDSPCQDTYIIDTDGNGYFSQSDGVARSLSLIVTMFHDLDAGEGFLPIVCKETKLANGNSYKTLEPVI